METEKKLNIKAICLKVSDHDGNMIKTKMIWQTTIYYTAHDFFPVYSQSEKTGKIHVKKDVGKKP